MIPPEQAILFISEMRERCTVISLDESEYSSTLEGAARQGLRGGRVYDALLLRCALKSKAEKIYTWNLKHFRSFNPDLAPRIFTP